jgi:carbonic anhydrase
MKAHTKITQAAMTLERSLQFLKEGNIRFQNNLKTNRNLLEQVNDTSEGQFPFATILSCIDSRVSAELVFDQGLGDILGSMEFACKLAGTKLIVVLGHTSCGAIKGACDDAKMGNLTKLIEKIKPSVNAVRLPEEARLRNSSNLEFVDNVSEKNVNLTIDRIIKESDVLAEMKNNGDILIIGAMYNINTGAVSFYD